MEQLPEEHIELLNQDAFRARKIIVIGESIVFLKVGKHIEEQDVMPKTLIVMRK
jgi:hypothetical protein